LEENHEGGGGKRPKKKRKLSLSHPEEKGSRMPGVERVAVPLAEADEVDVPQSPLLETRISKSPEPHISLPVFSLPALPDAPPKSILALQGLDQALVGAEVVNPSSRLPIAANGDDTHTGLSERTRKRLMELGINELFAGQTG